MGDSFHVGRAHPIVAAQASVSVGVAVLAAALRSRRAEAERTAEQLAQDADGLEQQAGAGDAEAALAEQRTEQQLQDGDVEGAAASRAEAQELRRISLRRRGSARDRRTEAVQARADAADAGESAMPPGLPCPSQPPLAALLLCFYFSAGAAYWRTMPTPAGTDTEYHLDAAN